MDDLLSHGVVLHPVQTPAHRQSFPANGILPDLPRRLDVTAGRAT
jgi:hypothetical protein